MTTDANQWLMATGVRSAKFEAENDQIDGTIMDFEMRQQTNYTTGAPLTWDDGKPRMQMVVTLLTEIHDDDDDDGLRKLYIKGQMQRVVQDAVRKTGVRGLAEGGRLFVRFTKTLPPAKQGMSGAKQYIAKYMAPQYAVPDGDGPPDESELPFHHDPRFDGVDDDIGNRIS